MAEAWYFVRAVSQPSATPPAAASSPPQEGPREIVTRPDPGLARGKWEAPRGLFYGVIVLVVLGAIVVTLAKLGVFARLRKKRAS